MQNVSLWLQKKAWKMYNKPTLEDYNAAMDLRKNFGWGSTKISSFLLKKGINIKRGAVEGWIYKNNKPFFEVLIKKIPESSRLLSNEKAYVLGVLSGDGCVSTGNRISLEVCDKDFNVYDFIKQKERGILD